VESTTDLPRRRRLTAQVEPARHGAGALDRYPPRRIAWMSIVVCAGVLFVGSVSGLLTVKVFHQYSTLKWAMLAFAPVLVIVLLAVRRPTMWAAGLVILTVPIEPYVATVHGQQVSVLFVAAGLATFVAFVEGGLHRTRRTSSALVQLLPWIVVLLVVPTVLGTGWQHQALYVALFLDVACICARVATLYPDGRLMVVLFFLGSTALQSSVAIAQHFTGSSFNLYGGAGTASYSAQNYFFNFGTTVRTTGTFFDPISLGNVLAMAVPLALVVVLRSDLRSVHRWFAGLAGLALLGGLTVSLSRASWLGAAIGVACVAFFSRGEQRKTAVVASVSILVGVVLVASALYGPTVSARFDSILHPTATTVRTAAGDKLRQEEWTASLHVFEANPLGGVGFNNLVTHLESGVPGTDATSHAQNTFLQYLAEGGLFGGAALALLAGGIAADLSRSRRSDWLYPGLVGAFATVAITWMTDYTVRYMAVAGCLAVLVGLTASGLPARATEVDSERPTNLPTRSRFALAEP
jgi:O-antigen ligase